MSWAANSSPLPRNWASIRRRVLRESDVCVLCGGSGADEVDHMVPRYAGGLDEPSNLVAVHQLCHRRKSAAEGHARKRELRVLGRRGVERHPGVN